jgi:hypothetical protein
MNDGMTRYQRRRAPILYSKWDILASPCVVGATRAVLYGNEESTGSGGCQCPDGGVGVSPLIREFHVLRQWGGVAE